LRPVLERRRRVTGRVDSVREHVAEAGGRYESLRPAERITRRAPLSIDPEPSVFAALRTFEHPEVFRATLSSVRVAGDHPLVLTRDGRALRQSTFDLDQLNANPVMTAPLPRARRASGPHMLLVNPWAQAYFHWILDTLPRAALLPLDEHPEAPIIVPGELTRVHRESLELVGLEPDRLLPMTHPHLLVDELWFPSLSRTGNPPRWALEWLRSKLVPDPPAASSRRLYVSRADAGSRRVVNEADVASLLAERGFEAIVPAQLPLRDQMALFAEAEAIVGPHGAGLLNTLAAESATVIELFEPRYVNGCFYALCDAIDNEYWFMMCEPAGETDLLVDLDRLALTLDRAGV
jgi:capsular polysaccharide biosynthesis protein